MKKPLYPNKIENYNYQIGKGLKGVVIELLKNRDLLPKDTCSKDELAIILGFFANDFLAAIERNEYHCYLEVLSKLTALDSEVVNDLLIVDLFTDINQLKMKGVIYQELDKRSQKLYNYIAKTK